MVGVPATVAEMSIRQVGSRAARSDGYKTTDAQRRETVCSPQVCPKGSSDPQAGLGSKCDQEPAGGENERSLSCLGGVIPKAEGGPDAFESPLK